MRKITQLLSLIFFTANLLLSAQTPCTVGNYQNNPGVGIYITNFTTSGADTNINNSSGFGNSSTSNDYTSTSSVVTQAGNTINYSISFGRSNLIFYAIYLDSDGDGNFTTLEYLDGFSTGTGTGGTVTSSFTVPASLADGTYRLRLVCDYYSYEASYASTQSGGCGGTGPLAGQTGYGEVEDYSLVVAAPPSCGTPSGLTATLDTFDDFTTADLAWTAGDSNDSYTWSVYAGTDTTATPVATSTTTSTSATVSGLTTNTSYTAVLSASCASESAQSSISTTFTTNHLISGAHTEDFGTYSELGFASQMGTSGGSWYNSSAGINFAAFTGDASPYMPNTGPTIGGGTDGGSTDIYWSTYYTTATSGSDVIFTPYFDVSSMTTPRLSLDYHINGTSAGNLTVTLIQSDGTETVVLAYTGAQQFSNSETWRTGYADLSSYDEVVRFKITGTYGGSVSFDDFIVEETPSCNPPSMLTVTNITDTSASYSWTPDGTNTSVTYTTTDSTGATVASASGTNSDTIPSVNVTGLSGNTTYTITLTGTCDTDSSSSISTTFTTACSPYTIPFNEGFETGYTSSSNIGTTGGNGNSCFTEEQVGTSAYYAYAYNGTAGTLVTPNTGDWSAFAGTSATDVWYFFDVALTGGVSYTASVYARASSALSAVTEGSVSISYGASASAADMTTQVVAPSVLGTSYELSTGEFTPSSDGTYTIGVNVVHDGAFGGYLNFDDLSVIETPNCSEPTGLSISSVTSSSATYSWVAGNGNTDYSYSTTDASGTEVASASGTTTSGAVTVDVTGLSANTAYTVTVTGVCGLDTAGSTTTSFTTSCDVATAGFSENFNGLSSMPSCWEISNGGDANAWEYRSAWNLSGGYSFNGAAGLLYGSTAHDDYLYSPEFTVADGLTDGLSFNALSPSSTYPEPLDISVVSSTTGLTTLIYDDYEVGTYETAYHSEFYDLSAFEGENIKIAFHSTTTDRNIIMLDNFVVGSASTMSDGWAGFQSGDFANAQNWYAGSVPTGDVTLNLNSDSASNSPDIASAVSATSLTINTGVSLTISENGSLQTTGDFTNGGTVTMSSTATAHSSLIVGGTSTGSITYNRYAAADRWYITSSPVVGQDIDEFIAGEDLAVSSNNSSLVGLADYNNDGSQYAADPTITTGWWDYHQSGDDGVFTPGKGKIVRLASDATDNLLGFKGTISGSVSVPMTVATTAFNLVGNPYPAAVQVTSQGGATNDVLSTNSSLLSEETAWFWNGASNGYEAVNQNPSQAAKITAPGQGFFVSASGSGDLSFTTAMQTTSAGSFARQTEWSKIDLSMSADSQSSETEIVYFDGATTGWDNGYDSTNWSSGSFQIFTSHVDTSTSQNLAIQSLPLGNFNDMVVPVGVNASAGQTITISVDTTNWPEGVKIYLEDVDNSSYTLLDGQNAEFTTLLDSNESGIGRFYIHTTSNSLGDEDLTLTDVSIYASSRDNLRILGINSGQANVQMFDLMGKQVLNTSFNGQSVNDVKLPNLNTGIYLVNLASDEGTVNKKIIIQ